MQYIQSIEVQRGDRVGTQATRIEGTMFSLVTVAAIFLACLLPEAVSQQGPTTAPFTVQVCSLGQ